MLVERGEGVPCLFFKFWLPGLAGSERGDWGGGAGALRAGAGSLRKSRLHPQGIGEAGGWSTDGRGQARWEVWRWETAASHEERGPPSEQPGRLALEADAGLRTRLTRPLVVPASTASPRAR